MAQIIEMPKLSDTMEEGSIVKWFKKEGEYVESGDTLVEIETDKSSIEYESPEEGYLLKILLEPAKSVALNSPIAVLAEKDEKVDIAELVIAFQKENKKEENQLETPKKQDPISSTEQASSVSRQKSFFEDSQRVKASPLAKKLAKEYNVSLASLQGSGPHQRIIARDIQRNSTDQREDQKIPLTSIRKTIAKRLLFSKQMIPHFYLHISANMDTILQWRESINSQKNSNFSKITVNDLIIFATAQALKLHPQINASWQEDHILQKSQIDIAFAFAAESGLVTPIIRNTASLSLYEISEKVKEIIKKAKENKLEQADYTGGSLTISNLGMFGIEDFSAIINPPQASILAIGKTILRPWVDKKQQIILQKRMKITLSCDHRVIDGAIGAQFLQTLVSYIEDPLNMLANK